MESPLSVIAQREAAKLELREAIIRLVVEADRDRLWIDTIMHELVMASSRASRDSSFSHYRRVADLAERMLDGTIATKDDVVRFVGDGRLSALPPRKKKD